MKVVSALLGLALAVMGGLLVHFSSQVEAGRQQVAELKAQLQERDARIASLAVAPVAAPAVPFASTASLAPNPAAVPSPSAAAVEPALSATVQDMLATIRAQSSSPEAVARRRLTTRTLMETSNPDIDEALGLTPEEKDKLLDLLATQQERMSEVFQTNVDGNNATSVAERTAALRAHQQTSDAELQAMLGSKYDQWKDYNETRAAWSQRRDLRAVLDAGGIPMTDAQSKSLITALTAERRMIIQQARDAASRGGPVGDIIVTYTPERSQRLLDAAAPYLSPQQLEGYRGLLERAVAQDRARVSSMQAAQERAAAAAAAAPR